MDKYKRYAGVILFIVLVIATIYVCYSRIIGPLVNDYVGLDPQITNQEKILEAKRQQKHNIEEKIKKIQDSIRNSQKKIYSPLETDLGNDSLFFTLYNDVIDMIHSNSVKIKSIDYEYNPKADKFVEYGKDVYFVCDVKMELVSNYVNLGKLLESIYAYPYYIKINKVSVKPYPKDKKILLTDMSLRLYAHTSPDEQALEDNNTEVDKPMPPVNKPANNAEPKKK